MVNHLTGEQIRVIVAEINAWTKAAYPEAAEAGEWQIAHIEHLYSLSDEAYRITYTDGYQGLFQRDTSTGKLHAVATWSHEAQHNFEDRHKSVQQASAQISEGGSHA